MRASANQTSFNTGEVSQIMLGRVDFERLRAGMSVCVNGIPLIQGPWTRRPGFYICDEVKDSTRPTRSVPFKYNTGQSYAIEFGHFYARFKKNRAPAYDRILTITNVSNANPGVVTYTGLDPANGDDMDLAGLAGALSILNGLRVRVSNVNAGANTFEMTYVSGSNVNTTAMGAYTSGGTASRVFTLTTPYDSADLFQLKFSRSVDKLYVFHPDYPEASLNRFSDANWTHTPLAFLDGPYLPVNKTTTTLTPSAFAPGTGVTVDAGPLGAITNCANNGAGLIRVTDAAHGYTDGIQLRITGVTGTVEANGVWEIDVIDANNYDLVGSAFVNAYAAGGATRPALFASTDVGRFIRMKQGSTWGYCIVTAFTNESTVTVTIINTLVSTAAKTDWRLGLRSDTTGYATCGAFFGDRLYIGGVPYRPSRFDGSQVGDYLNFAETDTLGVTTDSMAVTRSLNSEDVQRIRWMRGTANGLVIGTSEGEWLVSPSSNGEAITPVNIDGKQSTGWGSDDTEPVQVGNTLLFIQAGSRRIRELEYQYVDNKLVAPDVTVLAEQLTKGPTTAESGLVELAFQKERVPIVWGPRKDGQLAGVTFSKDDKVNGPHRHTLGGYSNSGHTAPAKVKSCCAIPAADGSYTELWAIVERYINGRTVQYHEFLTQIWERGDQQLDSFFVDSGISYRGPATQTITGLHHLAGETIQCLVNGATHPDVVVSANGTVQLNSDAMLLPTLTAHFGYGYNSDGATLRQDVGAADGTAQGKLQRTHRMGLRLMDSLGVEVGPSFTKLSLLTFRTSAMATGQMTPLFTGDKVDIPWNGSYTTENIICWRIRQPLPATILSVMPQMNTEDR
jgi:hypothetical protein